MITGVDLPAGLTLPPEIRGASEDVRQQYRSALAFERVLLGQLTKAMQSTVSSDGDGDGDGESGGTSAATQAYKDRMPDTMADAILAGGGIGIASDLVRTTMRTDKT